MPQGGAGGQNIKHPHTPAILSSFFCFKCILVLLARNSSGELRCSATALIPFVHDSFLCSIRKYGMCMCKDMDQMLIMVCLAGHSF